MSGGRGWGIGLFFLVVEGEEEEEEEEGGLPEVVVEVVGAGFVGFVGEDDAGAAVVVVAVGVRDEAFLDDSVRHGGVDGRGRVAV